MQLDDIEIVVELEQQLFETPWDRLRFQRSLERQQPAWVALSNSPEPSEFPVGYLVASSGGGVADLLTIGVSPKCQRSGIAAQLLAQLLTQLQSQQVQELFLEVRVSNEAAIGFYRANGFEQVGVRRNYYRRPATPDEAEGREDGLLFKRELTQG
ncbi:ribosomal-protein-alanine N-acetyltransferase [Motiliproteus coralliicola]|uniref:[Ribosomal protein bS18]-alanine N-acetyltransferase n=2 Tax=Motiliproteus coralliicola TaxID=2283196 RepID=A0A369WE92_9GAMM|nr:ribosomal-protein-alanine N-acetyltransferase [Motiliproteus coralliicola]